MAMNGENIKLHVEIYIDGHKRPKASTEDFGVLKDFFAIGPESESYTEITEVPVIQESGETEVFNIKEITIGVMKQTEDAHLKYGISLTRVGEALPYNMIMSIYLESK